MKPKLQARHAALSFSEKIKILEKLRDSRKGNSSKRAEEERRRQAHEVIVVTESRLHRFFAALRMTGS